MFLKVAANLDEGDTDNAPVLGSFKSSEGCSKDPKVSKRLKKTQKTNSTKKTNDDHKCPHNVFFFQNPTN